MTATHKSRVLICEKEPQVSRGLERTVESLGYRAQAVPDEDEVLSELRDSGGEISALIIGIETPDRVGMNILREVRAIDARLPVIIVVSSWSTRDVVAALRNGATEFLCKPITGEEVDSVLTSALETRISGDWRGPRSIHTPRAFKSANPRVKEIESRVGQIGASEAPVLIQGETGSGKEVLARRLHAHSTRATKPFLKLNCAALPSELVESELFGYERGAFTGAFERKSGIFELADGGTILLDEIGDMDIRLQAKLLQVLQDQEFRRIGGKENVKVNVRVIAATHRDLETAIHEQKFREDLYYRLNVIVLHVPALRQRKEDILPLAEILLRKHADQGGAVPVISANLRSAMLLYSWPGNVRELENYMRKLLIFQNPDALACDLEARMHRKPPLSVQNAERRGARMESRNDMSILDQVTKDKHQAESEAILAALSSTRWNRKQAAGILKIEYKSLLYKMKKLGIDDSPVSLPVRSEPPFQRAASGD